MRTAIENWLLGYWYGRRPPPWYLRMLEPVYRAGFERRRKSAVLESAPCRPKLPLIVVGNITAGGSGKTPLLLRLCQIALELNFKPGIASTGYGRRSRESIVVTADCEPDNCGDEPVMLAQRTGVPVVVAASRLDAVKQLDEMGLDLIFSDDGLQQANMCRDIEFCVVDGERGLGNGHLIPAGPLRESVERLRQVDYVISNGIWPARPADLDVSVMQLEPRMVCSLDSAKVLPVAEFQQSQTGKPIHAFAGIGNPGRFFNMLKGLGINAICHGFSDHHRFERGDFDTIKAGSVILMTEKDAVKCRSLRLENAWYVPVETRLPGELEDQFKDQLTQLVKQRL